MSTIDVAAINCSSLPFDEFERGVEVLQLQLDQHFSTRWDVGARLSAVDGSTITRGVTPGSSFQQHWSLVVFDSRTSEAVRNGYRDMTRFGCPQAKVEIQPDSKTPRQWTASVSRALLRLLANPHGVRFISTDSTPRRRLFPVDPCDPLVNDSYEIDHPSKTSYSVAAFVFPGWFDGSGAGPLAQGVAIDVPQTCSSNGGRSVSYLMGDGANAGGWQVSSSPARALAGLVAAGAPSRRNSPDTAPDPQEPVHVPLAPAADPEAPSPTVQPNDYFLPP